MASKSNLLTTIDNGSGVTITIKDDASGFIQFTMSDGTNTVSMKLSSADSTTLRSVLIASLNLRQAVPQS